MKKYTLADLFQFVATMAAPVFVFILQCVWYVGWCLDLTEYWIDNHIFYCLDYSPVLLVMAIINSHCWHFCKYHRAMMYGLLTSHILYFLIPDDYADIYVVLLIICMLTASVGFTVTMYRFLKQIIKYIRKLKTIARRVRRSN